MDSSPRGGDEPMRRGSLMFAPKLPSEARIEDPGLPARRRSILVHSQSDRRKSIMESLPPGVNLDNIEDSRRSSSELTPRPPAARRGTITDGSKALPPMFRLLQNKFAEKVRKTRRDSLILAQAQGPTGSRPASASSTDSDTNRVEPENIMSATELYQELDAEADSSGKAFSSISQRELIGRSSEAFYRKMAPRVRPDQVRTMPATENHQDSTAGLRPSGLVRQPSYTLLCDEDADDVAVEADEEELDIAHIRREQALHLKLWEVIDSISAKRNKERVVPHFTRPSRDWKTVKIWVCSAGSDTLSERDEFRQHVMPRIRERCRPFRLDVIECDLRYGATALCAMHGVIRKADDQFHDASDPAQLQAQFLRILMKEFESCMATTATSATRLPHNMFFISFIGRKYGWIPSDDVLTRSYASELWHWKSGFSLMAMELIHAVYMRPNPNAYVYVRSDGFMASDDTFTHLDKVERKRLEAELALQFVDSFGSRVNETVSMPKKDELKSWKLDVLIEKLRRKLPEHQFIDGYPCTYANQEDDGNIQRSIGPIKHTIKLSGLEQLARSLEMNLVHALTDYFKIDISLDVDSRLMPRADLGACLKRVLHANVARPSLSKFLDNYLARGLCDEAQSAPSSSKELKASNMQRPLYVIGESGIGKTHLLASLYQKLQKSAEPIVCLSHFSGLGSADNSVCGMLEKFIGQMCSYCSLEPEDSSQLISFARVTHDISKRFAFLIEKLPQTSRYLFIIDGVDQLIDHTEGLSLGWIPLGWSNPSVKIILSCQTCAILKAHYQEIGYEPFVVNMPSLSMDDRVAFIKAYIYRMNYSLYPTIKDKTSAVVMPGFLILSEKLILQLAVMKKAGNPLWLHGAVAVLHLRCVPGTNLSELQGYFSELPSDFDELVSHYVNLLLQRSGGRSIRPVLSYLICSKNGILESELRSLNGNIDGPLPAYDYASVASDLMRFLAQPWMSGGCAGLSIYFSKIKSALASKFFWDSKTLLSYRMTHLISEEDLLRKISKDNTQIRKIHRTMRTFYQASLIASREKLNPETVPRGAVLERYHTILYCPQAPLDVAVRLRPVLPKDIFDRQKIHLDMKPYVVSLLSYEKETIIHNFQFDTHIQELPGEDDRSKIQQEAFYQLNPSILHPILQEKSTTVFAIGYDDSGKTFSLFGDQNDDGFSYYAVSGLMDDVDEVGDSLSMSMSMIEIYEEEMSDLLYELQGQRGSSTKTLKINDPTTYTASLAKATDCVSLTVKDALHFRKLLKQAMSLRAKEFPVAGGVQASRFANSAVILQLEFRRTKVSQGSRGPNSQNTCTYHLTLVDMPALIYAPLNITTDRVTYSEFKYTINRSLLSLLRCWLSISQGKRPSLDGKSGNVSYQDSKLTWLTKDAMEGAHKTLCLLHISPSRKAAQDNLHTLKAGSMIKKAKNALLSAASGLPEVDIDWESELYGDSGFEYALLQSLRSGDITALSLRPNTISPENINVFAKVLHGGQSIQSIRLLSAKEASSQTQSSEYSSELIKVVADYIGASKALKHLIIQVSLPDSNMQLITDAMRVSTSLYHFHLQCPDVGIKGATSLSTALGQNANIKRVTIRQGYVGLWQVPLARWLSFTSHVTHLDLNHQDMTNDEKNIESIKRLSALLAIPSSMVRLSLRNTNLGVDSIAALVEGALKCPQLEELDLGENKLEAAMPYVINLIKYHTTLSVLHISGCPISFSTAIKLGEAVVQSSVIKEIRLNVNIYIKSLKENQLLAINWSEETVSDSDIAVLAMLLYQNKSVEVIDLRNCVIGLDASLQLADVLHQHPGIKKIHLNSHTTIDIHSLRMNVASTLDIRGAGAHWGDTDLFIALLVLKSNRSVVQLLTHQRNLSISAAYLLRDVIEQNANIDQVSYGRRAMIPMSRFRSARPPGKPPIALPEGFSAIDMIVWSGFLKQNPAGITVLDLSPTNIVLGDTGLLALAEALVINSCITALDLSCNALSDRGGVALAVALLTNNSIIDLNLSYNNLGEMTAEALASSLKVNKTLKVLDLSFNYLDEKCISLICPAVGSHPHVELLDLKGNQIGEKGAIAVASMLKASQSLLCLSLAGSSLKEKGAVTIAEAMWGNHKLRSLDLSYNKIGDKAVSMLSDSLKANRGMCVLDLECNNLTDKGGSSIVSLLRDNKNIHSINLGFNKFTPRTFLNLQGALLGGSLSAIRVLLLEGLNSLFAELCLLTFSNR
eukprot:TRINITY_DN5385_c0_g1_i1.p1 TRINITY_DN5385_c0_g1~~TRINITY_DN5385_c0_g1_i1.p1  ORF type:complete len:2210 (+),score=439.95 TRINITY_DN5385_c0_g1_i1:82-6711(+)